MSRSLYLDHPRAWVDGGRWYAVDSAADRAAALDMARRYARSKAHGPDRRYRVIPGRSGWIVQQAARPTPAERAHAAHYNRAALSARPMGL